LGLSKGPKYAGAVKPLNIHLPPRISVKSHEKMERNWKGLLENRRLYIRVRRKRSFRSKERLSYRLNLTERTGRFEGCSALKRDVTKIGRGRNIVSKTWLPLLDSFGARLVFFLPGDIFSGATEGCMHKRIRLCQMKRPLLCIVSQ